MKFYDTETCGLHGIAVLIQWADSTGPIELHHVFERPVKETLQLIEHLMSDAICGFNMAYDHFHLSKLHTIFSMLDDGLPDANEILNVEPLARDGRCIKPVRACDLMLHARKGKFQYLMERKPVIIRRIPKCMAQLLIDKLESDLQFEDILFARRRDKMAPKWVVQELDDEFVNVKLSFKASGSLKNLVEHITGKTTINYKSIECPIYHEEVGWKPYGDWKNSIAAHRHHWRTNELAKEYAYNDIVYTRFLWDYFEQPPGGDTDSELACCVAACRWRGYTVNLEAVEREIAACKDRMGAAPREPRRAKKYISEVMSDIEKIVLSKTSKKIVLEEISKWDDHPAAKRAEAVLEARKAKWELDLFNKIKIAGRLHASFSVIGALSGRMSGSGGDLNPQGIKREERIRSLFTFKHDNESLGGGDFDSFEITLIDAAYPDPKLHADLQTGIKLHGKLGTYCYDMTYEEVMASKEHYTRAKSGVFAIFYGGEAYTLQTRLGVPIDKAEKAYQLLMQDYPQTHKERQRVFNGFKSMTQPGGIGTAVKWAEPSEYIESLFGFRRYFTLENRICKFIFELAQKPPKEWRDIKTKVQRRDRVQTASGSVQSALYGAAFGIQSSNMRVAGNHRIQSSGAFITKEVQRAIWDLQPSGVNDWIVQPYNGHDEIITPVAKGYEDIVEETVYSTIESFRPTVPLIKMEWKKDMSTWAEK